MYKSLFLIVCGLITAFLDPVKSALTILTSSNPPMKLTPLNLEFFNDLLKTVCGFNEIPVRLLKS